MNIKSSLSAGVLAIAVVINPGDHPKSAHSQIPTLAQTTRAQALAIVEEAEEPQDIVAELLEGAKNEAEENINVLTFAGKVKRYARDLASEDSDKGWKLSLNAELLLEAGKTFAQKQGRIERMKALNGLYWPELIQTLDILGIPSAKDLDGLISLGFTAENNWKSELNAWRSLVKENPSAESEKILTLIDALWTNRFAKDTKEMQEVHREFEQLTKNAGLTRDQAMLIASREATQKSKTVILAKAKSAI